MREERTEWAIALRLLSTRAAGRHTETRGRRAYHDESSNHLFFLDFDQAVPVDYIRDWIFVGWLCCISFMGNAPPQFSRTL